MLVTIFTPTYNRISTLPQLYKSLCDQTYKDFEWLIVDDGSIDKTEDLINSYILQDIISIRYIKQPNGGKHRAINRGVELANGYLFMILDSDDYLADRSVLSFIEQNIGLLKLDSKCCAIVGNKINNNKVAIGSQVSYNVLLSNFIDYRERLNIQGDKAEVVKTAVMKEYKLPEFESENFGPEGIIWNRMAKYYTAIYYNADFMVCEYQEDGLSAAIKTCRQNNPKAFLTYYSEYCNLNNARYFNKIKRSILYWAVRCKTTTRIGAKIMQEEFFYTKSIGWLLHKIGVV